MKTVLRKTKHTKIKDSLKDFEAFKAKYPKAKCHLRRNDCHKFSDKVSSRVLYFEAFYGEEY